MQADHDLILSGIISLASQHDDVEVLWLYGSRATGGYHTSSDFDLAIAFKNFDLSPMDKLSRPHEIAMDWALILEVPTNLISIVDINTIPAYLGFNVVEYGVILYQESSARSYKEANRIYSQYEYQIIESKRDES
jgi:predicted nucleotidyltransferase